MWKFWYKKTDASVTVRGTTGGQECVTASTFRAWKKRAGRRRAFVLQIPESDGYVVQTYRDMLRRPPGTYAAELVQQVKIPSQGELEGCVAWKCV